MNERSSVINLGGQEYELLLTTLATKQIAKRFGGLEQLGEKLMKVENFESALEDFCWLIMVLANQPIMLHNLQQPDKKKPLLTEELLELLTSPFELGEYRDAISEAMFKGMQRNVESAPPEPGNEGNTKAE